MQFNIDKKFIQILNKQGHSITWEQFREAYSVRKKQRDTALALAVKKSLEAPKRRSLSLVEIEDLLFSSHIADREAAAKI